MFFFALAPRAAAEALADAGRSPTKEGVLRFFIKSQSTVPMGSTVWFLLTSPISPVPTC